MFTVREVSDSNQTSVSHVSADSIGIHMYRGLRAIEMNSQGFAPMVVRSDWALIVSLSYGVCTIHVFKVGINVRTVLT